MKKSQDLYFGETLKEVVMKSWIRRFALLAVMGSLVGGIVMAGCSSSNPDTDAPADNATAPADQTAPPADAPAPPADAPAPPPAP
jgi:hypothetical protein